MAFPVARVLEYSFPSKEKNWQSPISEVNYAHKLCIFRKGDERAILWVSVHVWPAHMVCMLTWHFSVFKVSVASLLTYQSRKDSISQPPKISFHTSHFREVSCVPLSPDLFHWCSFLFFLFTCVKDKAVQLIWHQKTRVLVQSLSYQLLWKCFHLWDVSFMHDQKLFGQTGLDITHWIISYMDQ